MDETNKGFMKHLGGLDLKKIDDTKYEFSVKVKEMHLNTGKIAHGGFLSTIADTGMGTAAHRVAGDRRCVTINLDMKLPIGQIDKSKYKEYLQDQLKKQKIMFFLLLFSLPLVLGVMETYAAKYTKAETSKSITQPVAYVSTGEFTGSAFLTGEKTLLTARHVVKNVEIGGKVKLIFMTIMRTTQQKSNLY